MNTLFNDQNNEIEPFDPDKDWAAEYLSEGGKFYDPDPEVAKKKIARAKAEADYTVKMREREQAELRKDYLSLREEYTAAQSLKEYIDQLTTQAHTSNENNQTVNDVERPALNLNELESILEQRETKKREDENLRKVQSKLVDRYGPNFTQHLKAQREELGMSAEEVDRMAKSNPTAFEKLFLSTTQHEEYSPPPKSSSRSDSFAPRTQKKNWAFYEDLRKTKPSVYWEPKTINQMHEDRKALGADFYS